MIDRTYGLTYVVIQFCTFNYNCIAPNQKCAVTYESLFLQIRALHYMPKSMRNSNTRYQISHSAHDCTDYIVLSDYSRQNFRLVNLSI